MQGDWLKNQTTDIKKRIASMGGKTHSIEHMKALGKIGGSRHSREHMIEIGRRGAAVSKARRKSYGNASIPTTSD